MEKHVCDCRRRHKERSEQECRALDHRLARIEGQVRGLRGMLEKSAYCPDILVECAAVNAALHAFERELLAEHVRTCVRTDLVAGHEETVDELVKTLQKLMK